MRNEGRGPRSASEFAGAGGGQQLLPRLRRCKNAEECRPGQERAAAAKRYARGSMGVQDTREQGMG